MISSIQRTFPLMRLARLCAPALAASMLFSAASGQAQPGPAVPEPLKAVVAKAQQEGAVTLFGYSVQPGQQNTLQQRFNAAFGTSISVKMISSLHPVKVAEILQAGKLGVPSDIDLFVTVSDMAEPMQEAGLLANVDWRAEANAGPQLLWGKSGLRISDGTLAMVVYNKNLVSAADAPKSYEDLLNPKFKGRIGMPRSPALAYIAFSVGEKRSEELLKELIEKQDLRLFSTYTDVVARVTSGELAIGIGMDGFVEARNGAPIAPAPIDPLVLTPWAGWIMKDAKHPNAARLMGHWLTTPTGQATLAEVRGISLVTTTTTPLWQFAQGKKLLTVPHEYSIANYPRMYRQHMGIITKR